MAVDVNEAAVNLHQLVHECEPDTRPLVRSRLRVRDPMEAFEDVWKLVTGDADPGVLNNQLGHAVSHAGADANLASKGVLERIREESENDLLPQVAVELHERIIRSMGVDDERQSRLLDCRPEGRCNVRHEARKVGQLEGRLHASGLDAREVEDHVHELEQSHGVAMNES